MDELSSVLVGREATQSAPAEGNRQRVTQPLARQKGTETPDEDVLETHLEVYVEESSVDSEQVNFKAHDYTGAELSAVKLLQAAAREAKSRRQQLGHEHNDHRLIRDIYGKCCNRAEELPNLRKIGDSSPRYRKLLLGIVPHLLVGLRNMHKRIISTRDRVSRLSNKAEGKELDEISQKLTFLSYVVSSSPLASIRLLMDSRPQKNEKGTGTVAVCDRTQVAIPR